MKSRNIRTYLILILGVIVANVVAHFVDFRLDFTEDKRYTISDSTIQMLENVNDLTNVKIYLNGDLPSSFRRLRNETMQLIHTFKEYHTDIEIIEIDPNEGDVQDVKKYQEQLVNDGIVPLKFRVDNSTQAKEQLIFPYVEVQMGRKKQVVNLIETSIGGEFNDQQLNTSTALLEYKIADAISKISIQTTPKIVFTTGQGELASEQFTFLQQKVEPYYEVISMNMDTTFKIPSDVELLIIAKPTEEFSSKKKFVIDQYVMNGGKVLWALDRLDVTTRKIQEGRGKYIPQVVNHNLDDLLFKYGIRINPDLVMDLECTRIPQVVGQVDGRPQIELLPWFYHVLSVPNTEIPMMRGVDRVNLFYPSSIDTLKTEYPVIKDVLLKSSQYTMYQVMPVQLGFDVIKYANDPKFFNKPSKILAVALEGQFSSPFKNRLTDDFLEGWKALGNRFVTESNPTKMVVISDGDVIKNYIDGRSREAYPLGYNEWEKYVFKGNEQLILNALDYLIDENNLMQARSKEITLRMLDSRRAEKERSWWQMFNLLLPIGLLVIFGFAYNYIKRRKYAS